MSITEWKLRYAFEFHKRTGFRWTECWESAGAMLESLEGDTTELTPKDAVSEELSCWTD